MKITNVEAMICDAGWRPWTFVKIQTDTGLTGYGECSDNRTPHAIAGCIEDLKSLLLGQDPRPVERLYWDLYRATRQSPGGIAAKAMAERLRKEAGSDPVKQVDYAYRLALARVPTPGEAQKMHAFLNEQPLEELCRVLLNMNEFVYAN